LTEPYMSLLPHMESSPRSNPMSEATAQSSRPGVGDPVFLYVRANCP
jgi:hypothetical protein